MKYLTTLQDTEERMNNGPTKEGAQKDYYKLILKSKAIFNESLEIDTRQKTELKKTKQNYDSFLNFWATILSKSSLHIVNKQINIFTTNFDMLIEESCERLNLSTGCCFIAGQMTQFPLSVKVDLLSRNKRPQSGTIDLSLLWRK